MSKNILPMAVEVSIGYSVALSSTAFGLQIMHDVLQIFHGPGEAIDALSQ